MTIIVRRPLPTAGTPAAPHDPEAPLLPFLAGRRFAPGRSAGLARLGIAAGAVALALAMPLEAGAASRGFDGEYEPGQILVRYRAAAPAGARTALESQIAARLLRGYSVVPVRLLEVEGGVEAALAALRADPAVEYAEPNYRIRPAALPDDPLFGQQVGLRNTGQTGGIPGADIRAPQAWDLTTGHPNRIIAVFDTGIEWDHPDLASNMWTNLDEARGIDGEDDDVNGYLDDVHGFDFVFGSGDARDRVGHGTYVAGVIGAVGNNGIGIAGVQWRCQLLAIKVMTDAGHGSVGAVIAGLEYALLVGARLSCNAYTQSAYSQALLDAIEAAGSQGMLFVTAAGNDSVDTDVQPRYPGSYDTPYVINVAASDAHDRLARFSNRGAVSVDLAAPGVDQLTTYGVGSYFVRSGTSLAAGMVTGACGLAMTRFPQLGALAIRDLVLRSVQQVPDLAGRVATGGRLDAAAAVAEPERVPPSAILDLAVAEPGSNRMTLTWTAVGDDSTAGRATSYDLRYSTAPITADNFASATAAAAPAPRESGSPERVEVLGLATSTDYWFAVRAVDESRNAGPISNVVTGRTLEPPAIAVSPSQVSAALVSGGVATRRVRIDNVGQGTLDFTVGPPALFAAVAPPPSLEASPAPPAKGADGAPGPPVTAGSGGPDGFGYRWIDSADPYGPAFQWIDLTADPPLALTGDDSTSAPIPIGFDFPFYGQRFRDVVVGTNGYLSFTSRTPVYSNAPLPGNAGVAHMVAPLWEDFHFGTARLAWARRDGERFVVSWVGVPRFGGGGSYTFQAILSATGEIRFQYLRLGSVRNSATVGIQDGTRTVGLTVVHNAAYLRDSLAVRIRPLSSWLSVAPDSGRVAAGGGRDLTLRLDAAGLAAGTLRAELRIASNDPARPLLTLPVFLGVVAAPDLAVDLDPVAFDTVLVRTSATRVDTLRNRGPLPLEVRAVTSFDPGVTVTPSSFYVPPGGRQALTLRWTPGAVSTLDSEVEVWSNDPDAPRRRIRVTGTALEPPAIDVEPDSLLVIAYTGSVTRRPVVVRNTGGSTLDLRVRWNYADALAAGGAEGRGGPVVSRAGGPDRFGYRWQDSSEPGGPAFQWVDLLSATTPGTVVQASGDDENVGPIPIGFPFPFYGGVYSSFRVCTNGFLSLTHAAAPYVNQPLPSPAAPENLIAPLWDDLTLNGVPSIYYRADSSRLVVQYHQVTRYRETSPNTFQAILHRSGEIVYQYLSISTPNPDSCTVGIQNAARDDGLEIVRDAPWVRTGLAVRIRPPLQFLAVTPESARVAPGDSVVLDVRFDTAPLLAGTYRATLLLDSNVPGAARLEVPATLEVLGAGDLLVTPAELDFGTVLSGVRRSLPLVAANRGTAPLTVSSVTVEAPYEARPAAFVLAPGERETLEVTVTAPETPGRHDAPVRFASDDPDAPLVEVWARAWVEPPPRVVVTPDSLVMALEPGGVAETAVVIENAGAGDLVWSVNAVIDAVGGGAAEAPPAGGSAAGDPPAAIEAPADAAAEALPGKEVDGAPGPPVTSGQGGPDAHGYRWIDGDEPGGPPFAWQNIAATGTRLALSRDDHTSPPVPLPFPFRFYGRDFSSVRVCSNGWLSFTSGDSTYHNVRLPDAGARVPADLIAAFWDDVDLRRGGEVRVQGDTSQFVVSWIAVPKWVHAGAPPATWTFQVVLHRGGDIDLQYLDMNGVVNQATVGIQDGSRTIGLTVVHNAVYVRDSLRVRITRNANWLLPRRGAGVTLPGGRDTVLVRFDARGLEAGSYTGALEVRSNDPRAPVARVPARLMVIEPGARPAAVAAADLPARPGLLRVGRHPARGGAAFELALPRAAPVEVAVYDVRGRRVRRIAGGAMPAGRHRLDWDGRDAAGASAGPGIYFVRAAAAAWSATVRLVLVR